MMARKLFEICVFLCVYCILSAECNDVELAQSESDQLVFAHVLFRHGDRTILRPYPNDPYKEKSSWKPDGLAQVTKLGKKRQYELGKYLRKRYYNLLGNGRYSPSKVYVESSDWDRTLVSAAADLAGLFPPDEDQIWTDELRWLPIPIHTKPKHLDETLAAERPCPRYDRAFQDALRSPEFRAQTNEINDTIQRVLEYSGFKNGSIGHVFQVWDNSRVEQLENKTLPSWTQEILDENGPFFRFIKKSFTVLTHTKEMCKLKSGFLIREMLERFTQKTQSKLVPDHSLWIYSAHDLNIINLLNSFELFEPHLVPYASCILFELYKSKDNFYVQLFYRNTTDEDILPLNIPGCGTKCKIEEIYQFFEEVIPTQDFETECKLPSKSDFIVEPRSLAWSSDLTAPICCTIIVLIATIYGWRETTQNDAE